MPRFVHLSDLHLSVDTNQERMAGLLGHVARAIPNMRQRPDFVVVSGDLTDFGDAASYKALRPLIKAFPVPVVLALGNHDRRAPFHDVFGQAGSDAPYDHDTVLAGVHVITLDTLEPGHVAGSLDAAQLGWLETALACHPDLPKLIIAHHPPQIFEADLPWTCLDAESTARLAALIDGHKIIAILSGHIHMNRMSLWHGVPLVASSGLQSTIDVLHEGGLRILDGASFALCRAEDGDFTVHFVPMLPEAREIAMVDIARLSAAT